MIKYCGVATDWSATICYDMAGSMRGQTLPNGVLQHRRIYSDEVPMADEETLSWFKKSPFEKIQHRLIDFYGKLEKLTETNDG